MASGRSTTRVITLDDIDYDQLPILRLRPAPPPIPSSESSTANIGALISNWSTFFTNVHQNLDIEETVDNNREQALEKNEKKLNEIFDNVVAQVNDQRERAIKELQTLTPGQQADVISFWSNVQSFFTELLEWLEKIFLQIVEKLRQGWRLLKDTIKKLFETALNTIKNIFQ